MLWMRVGTREGGGGDGPGMRRHGTSQRSEQQTEDWTNHLFILNQKPPSHVGVSLQL
jgi:hypothetical protein